LSEDCRRDESFGTSRKDLSVGQDVRIVGLDVGNRAVDASPTCPCTTWMFPSIKGHEDDGFSSRITLQNGLAQPLLFVKNQSAVERLTIGIGAFCSRGHCFPAVRDHRATRGLIWPACFLACVRQGVGAYLFDCDGVIG